MERHRKRLPKAERERLIIEEAVRFFSEAGFEGQTRALAQRLGVTQPLLYRYFPDKDSLIERVFDEVYLKRWKPEWEDLLRDRSRPLVDRVIEFYNAYYRTIYKREFVRIFMFAGLKGEHINERYLDLVTQHIVIPVCREMRAELGLPELDEPGGEEFNLAWSLHSIVSQFALRQWVYAMPGSIEADIDLPIRAFIEGVISLHRKANPQTALTA